MIKLVPHIPNDPFAHRSPEQVEIALREMGFSRIHRDKYEASKDRKYAQRLKETRHHAGRG